MFKDFNLLKKAVREATANAAGKPQESQGQENEAHTTLVNQFGVALAANAAFFKYVLTVPPENAPLTYRLSAEILALEFEKDLNISIP